MKRTTAMFLATVLFVAMLCVLSIGTSAEILHGECGVSGSNVTSEFDTETGILTISGTGEMASFETSLPPWFDCRFSIKSIKIQEGVTNIGPLAFYECTSLTDVTIPNSVTSIEWCSFFYCTSLERISIPSSIATISDNAFDSCTALKTVINHSDLKIVKGSAEHGGVALYAEEIFAHAYEATVTSAPTHMTEGVKTYTCSVCKDTQTEALPKLSEHEWDDGTLTSAPTHLAAGVKSFTCPCGQTKVEPIAKIEAHCFGEWEKVDNRTHRQTCECGEISERPHGYVATTATTPTHTTEGCQAYTCSDCGHTYFETLPMLTEHVWNNGGITTPATEKAEGIKTFTCACGQTRTEGIAKLPTSENTAKATDSEAESSPVVVPSNVTDSSIDTKEPSTNEAEESSGCAASLSMSMLLLASVSLSFITKKKKEV